MDKKLYFLMIFTIFSCPCLIILYAMFSAESISFWNVFYILMELLLDMQVALHIVMKLKAYFIVKSNGLKHFSETYQVVLFIGYTLLHICALGFVLVGGQAYTIYLPLAAYVSVFNMINLSCVYFNEKYIYASKYGKLICIDDITEIHMQRDEKHSFLNVKITALDEKYDFNVSDKIEREFSATFEKLQK